MSSTDWSLSKENFYPSDSSLRNVSSSSHKSSLVEKKSSSIVDNDRGPRSALTSIHGSQPAVTHGILTSRAAVSGAKTSSSSSVREPHFQIYQDNDDVSDYQNSFLDETPSPSCRQQVGGSMTSTPEEPQRLPPYNLDEGASYSSPYPSFADDENKENVYPRSSAEQRLPLGAGVLLESRHVPFVPLDVQEMVLDQDEWEQNQEIFLRLSEELAQLHTTSSSTPDTSRRWSV